VTGLPVVGGFTVDIEWKTGRVVAATIRSTGGTAFEVRTGGRAKQYKLKRGRSIILDAGLEKWSE
jgi:alpha-L-fucosidase 2